MRPVLLTAADDEAERLIDTEGPDAVTVRGERFDASLLANVPQLHCCIYTSLSQVTAFFIYTTYRSFPRDIWSHHYSMLML
jgi:hypothetical protein